MKEELIHCLHPEVMNGKPIVKGTRAELLKGERYESRRRNREG